MSTIRGFTAVGLGAAALLLGSCVFDPNARCGEHMEEFGDAVKCVCTDGYAMTDEGCVKCGRNETPTPNGCQCDDGFERASDGRCRRAPQDDACSDDAASCGSEAPATPTGVGQTCSSDADCADTDATFCETFMSHTCLVQGCSGDEGCYAGAECCDLSRFGMPTLCVPEGSCP